METERRRYVIIGAGFAGAATAWHLHRAGCDDVLVVEREDVAGVHSSGRSAAMLRVEMRDDPELQPLADESGAVLRSGELAEFRRTGGVMLGWGDDDVSEHVPCLRGKGLYSSEDGIVDVAALLQRYLEGTEVWYGCELVSFDARDDGVHVETSRGTVVADVLVNAAGPWAGELAGLPLTPRNRTLYVSEPDTAIDPDWPFVWDTKGGYYLRPESGGWLLCACDEADAGPGDYGEDEDVLPDLGAKLEEHQPELGDLHVTLAWVGQRTFAPDRMPVIGFDARSPRLFHVAGLGGHGVTLSYAVGRIAAEALLGLSTPPAEYDPARLIPTTTG
ncbi:MAG: FAD-dependent oxidoreductase [Planctomycetota bacterium]|nr:FAD-dependent oxidoreductase [Planctomycetota bacterium]